MVRFTGVLADGRYCIYVLHLHNALAAIAAAVDAAAAEAKSHHVEELRRRLSGNTWHVLLSLYVANNFKAFSCFSVCAFCSILHLYAVLISCFQLTKTRLARLQEIQHNDVTNYRDRVSSGGYVQTTEQECALHIYLFF